MVQDTVHTKLTVQCTCCVCPHYKYIYTIINNINLAATYYDSINAVCSIRELVGRNNKFLAGRRELDGFWCRSTSKSNSSMWHGGPLCSGGNEKTFFTTRRIKNSTQFELARLLILFHSVIGGIGGTGTVDHHSVWDAHCHIDNTSCIILVMMMTIKK